MQEFAFRQNIVRFERLMKSEDDPGRRVVLTYLLKAELAKLAALGKLG